MNPALQRPAIWLLDVGPLEGRMDRMDWWCEEGGVPEWEWTAALRYRHRQARLLHLGARYLARQVLGRVLGERPEHVPLVIGKNGKPALADSPVQFSLAHSGGLAVCAVASAPVGVDVERFDRTLDWQTLANHHFHRSEAQWLGTSAKRGGRRFMALWTLKEAYIKALGQADSFAALRFRPVGGHRFKATHVGKPEGECRLVRGLEAYSMAICLLGARCEAVPVHWFEQAISPWVRSAKPRCIANEAQRPRRIGAGGRKNKWSHYLVEQSLNKATEE